MKALLTNTTGTITLTASTFGGHIVTERYAKSSLYEALDNFNSKLEYMKANNVAPNGTYFKYNENAIWVIDSIQCGA